VCQVGKVIFTLPICIRTPSDPGYPPSDVAVYHYFQRLPQDNDLSMSTTWAIACFVAAAHQVMLGSLQEIQKREGSDGQKVLAAWHNHMEHDDHRSFRRDFFESVLKRATEVDLYIPVQVPITCGSSRSYETLGVPPEALNAEPTESRTRKITIQSKSPTSITIPMPGRPL
jgi:hypothetical protein